MMEEMDWMCGSNNNLFKDLKGMYYTRKLTVQCGEFLFWWIQHASVVRNDIHFIFFGKLEKDSA